MSLAASILYRIDVHLAETVLSEIPKPFRSGYIQRTVVHLSFLMHVLGHSVDKKNHMPTQSEIFIRSYKSSTQ